MGYEGLYEVVTLIFIAYSLPIQMPNAPVIAPITTLTNADCAAVGASKFINHSAQRQLISVITSIMKRGSSFHFAMRSNVISAMAYFFWKNLVADRTPKDAATMTPKLY